MLPYKLLSSAHLEISGRSYPIARHQIALPGIDLIGWLETQAVYPKVFWQEKEKGITRAAIGSVLTFDHVPQVSSSNLFDISLYGGSRFNTSRQADPSWKDFPSTRFWLPQIEITQDNTHTSAVFYSLHKDAPPEMLYEVKGSWKLTSHTLIKRSELPDFTQWDANLKTALHAISSGLIDKIVLARRTTLQLSERISPWPMLRQLKLPCGALFAFQLAPELCFLGATPERLFFRTGKHLHTDAIAATCPRGTTLVQDNQLAQELLQSPKDQREFKIVKDFLEATLSPLADQLMWEGEDRVLKGSHVQHIHNCLKATLKNTISDADLIRALHPTPALGGYPRDNALRLLEEIEPFDRGWYGGLVGVISQEKTSFYVAIRSALLEGKQLHLFAGTGLVSGSTPKKEWEELEQKIHPFIEQFT